jgi:hypothetical protein
VLVTTTTTTTTFQCLCSLCRNIIIITINSMLVVRLFTLLALLAMSNALFCPSDVTTVDLDIDKYMGTAIRFEAAAPRRATTLNTPNRALAM